jgi:hypothetical protein
MKTLNQLECDKRSKELDAREEYLVEREKLLEEAPLSIKVLKGTIEAKQHQLDILNKKIKTADSSYEVRILEYRVELSRTEQQTEIEGHKLHKLEDMQTDIINKNNSLKAKQRDLQKGIKDDRAYKLEQDKLIEDSITEGNTTLKALQYEIDGLEEIKKTINYEIAILGTTHNEIQAAVRADEQQLEDLHRQHDLTEKDLQKSLKLIQEDIKAANSKHRLIIADTKEKLSILKRKEEEIMALRGAMKRERIELDTDKRRWENSKTQLYTL